MNKCKEVNIPHVDNTDIECYKFVNSKCIKVTGIPTDIRILFRLGENPSLDEVLIKIMTALAATDNEL